VLRNVQKELLEKIPNVRIVQRDVWLVGLWMLVLLVIKITFYLMVPVLITVETLNMVILVMDYARTV
jgi:hypothetical protein